MNSCDVHRYVPSEALGPNAVDGMERRWRMVQAAALGRGSTSWSTRFVEFVERQVGPRALLGIIQIGPNRRHVPHTLLLRTLALRAWNLP